MAGIERLAGGLHEPVVVRTQMRGDVTLPVILNKQFGVAITPTPVQVLASGAISESVAQQGSEDGLGETRKRKLLLSRGEEREDSSQNILRQRTGRTSRRAGRRGAAG